MDARVNGISIPTTPSDGDVQFNGEGVNELRINGETVWQRVLVPAGTVIFESSNPQTTSVSIPVDGAYEITVVGAGGGAASFAYCPGVYGTNWYGNTAGGGAGGYFKGTYNLTAGNISVTVASRGTGSSAYYKDNSGSASTVCTGNNGGASKVGSIITANGGNGGYAKNRTATAGTGGTVSYSSSNLVSLTTSSTGGTGTNSVSQGYDHTTESGGTQMNSSANGGTNASGKGWGGGASCRGWLSQNPIATQCSATANHGDYGYIKIVKA